jgi:outer membrane protein
MRSLFVAACAMALAQPIHAQVRDSTTSGPVLSLEEAITLAQRNNPQHQQSMTARQRAGAALRSAYGALFPSLSSSFNTSYREGRPQIFNGVEFGANTDVISSSASLSLQAQWSGASILFPKQQRASLDAAEADISSSEVSLRNTVATQYLTALQAQARADLQDTLVVTAEAQLELARARESVGSATSLDVRRAEVQLGQQQVSRIRERNSAQIELLRLFQQMGVPQPENARLSTTFPVTEPTYELNDLLDQARRGNPQLHALEARSRVADVAVTRSRMSYIPTLSISTGLSGFTQQQRDINGVITGEQQSALRSRASCFTQDSLRQGAGLPGITGQCNAIVFTPADADRIRNFNDKFPFDFTRNPLSFSVQLSLPIWDGFGREENIQQATAARRDADLNVRQQQLALTAEVTTAYLNLQAAYAAVQIQERNSVAARDAQTLAQERFRVGAGTFIDVQQARADYELAETDRINAIYDFHKAVAALEAAVGRPLR